MASANGGGKGKNMLRRQLTLKEKIDILDAIKNEKMVQRVAALKFGAHQSTVSKIVKAEDQLRRQFATNAKSTCLQQFKFTTLQSRSKTS
jgi:predicted XRE-type DNA-binding protein